MTHAVATARLAKAAGLTAEDVAPLAKIADLNADVESFWKEASAVPPSGFGGDADALITRYRLGERVGRMKWADGAGQLLALVDRKLISSALGAVAASGHGRAKALLVVPFWDLKGRIRSLLYISHDRGEFTRQFRRIAYPGAPCDSGGLAFRPAVERVAAGKPAFVLDDIDTAIRLQARQLADSPIALPMVAVSPLAARWSDTDWAGIKDRAWTCWSEDQAKSTRLAYLCRGNVAPCGPNTATLDRYMTRALPAATLKSLGGAAIHRDRALASVCESLPVAEATLLIDTLAIEQADRSRLIAGFPAPLRRALVSARSPRASHVKIAGTTMIEVDGCWRLKNGELVADAAIAIDRVVLVSPTRTIYYEGVIRRPDGRSLPFFVPAIDVDPDPFDWMYLKLLDAGLGVLAANHRWSRNAIHLANQFHPPTQVTVGGVGWDAARGLFVFPRMTIGADGALPAASPLATLPAVPCLDFEPAPWTDPAAILAFSRPEAASAWAILCATVAAAIAPAIGATPVSTALVGPIDAATPLLASLGCPGVSSRWPMVHAAAIAAMAAIGSTHSWPHRVFKTVSYRQSLSPEFILSIPPGWFAPLDGDAADAATLAGGWQTIRLSPAPDTEIAPAAGAILVSFLGSLCANGLDIGGTGSLTRRVLELAEIWFASVGGEIPPIRAARDLIRDDPAIAFGNLMARVVDRGRCAIAHAELGTVPKPRRGDWFATFFGGERVHMPKNAFDVDLRSSYLIRTPLDRISTALGAAGVLREESEYRGHEGWVVDASWWCVIDAAYRIARRRSLA